MTPPLSLLLNSTLRLTRYSNPTLKPIQLALSFSTNSIHSNPIPIKLAFDSYLPPSSPVPSGSNSTCDIKAPLVILHGLYGSKQNWRSLAKGMSKKLNREIITLDLRNHGVSPHAKDVSYLDLASDVQHFIEERGLEDVVIMGHSMGGKVAMTAALFNLPSVSKLIVVDMAPGRGKISVEFTNYLEAMKEIDSLNLSSRKEADEVLSKYEKDLSVRQFLLTNLERPKGSDYYKFRLPLDYLTNALEEIGDFPFDSSKTKWDKPTLFIKGAKSKYINRHNIPIIKEFFPNFKLVSLDAGHWVHAERPKEFLDEVDEFLKEVD